MLVYEQKKRIKSMMMIPLVWCLFLEGCQMRREVSVTLPEKSSEFAALEEAGNELQNVRVTYQPLDFDTLTPLFLGITSEEAETYRSQHVPGNCYEMDGLYFVFHEIDSEYTDWRNGGVGECYCSAWLPEYGRSSSWTRDYFPLDSLESCSKEEAVAVCKPYAEAFGYADADISVYAMTVDCLNRGYTDISGHAPDPDYPLVTYEEIYAAYKEGKNEEYNDLYMRRHVTNRQGGMWEEGDEALMLVYRPMINGKVVYGFCTLQIIYVPGLEQAVKVWGTTGLKAVENLDVQKLITKEEALSAAVLALGFNSQELITVRDISLEYYIPEAAFGTYEEDKMEVIPCWKIDMEPLSEEAERRVTMQFCGTIWIDAVTGKMVRGD